MFRGTLEWSQERRYETEVASAEARYAPIYDRFAKLSIGELAADADARRIGERLFLNHCTACHASDARGGTGYPNLRDADWQWGGTPEAIEATIQGGRQGVMAAWGPQLGEPAVANLAQYVLTLAGRPARAEAAAEGKLLFEAFCFSCHRMSGQGNPAVGAPNLTDGIWRWGGSEESIRQTIRAGRTGVMPAHGELLGASRVRLVAAYVYGLEPDA
jgi:cytochrome c oxidase cbb3-type subunit 3